MYLAFWCVQMCDCVNYTWWSKCAFCDIIALGLCTQICYTVIRCKNYEICVFFCTHIVYAAFLWVFFCTHIVYAAVRDASVQRKQFKRMICFVFALQTLCRPTYKNIEQHFTKKRQKKNKRHLFGSVKVIPCFSALDVLFCLFFFLKFIWVDIKNKRIAKKK